MADRYWVGGTANWDGTAGTKWAATSGGAGGASVPSTIDDVFFDAVSTGTVTIATGNGGAKSINCTGFTGTITGSAGIIVAGSVTLSTGMTISHSGIITVSGTGTVTTAGKTLASLFISGSGITVTLGDALTASNNLNLTQGTFDAAGYNVTARAFNTSNANVRTLYMGSGLWTLTGTGTLWNSATTTNLTLDKGTADILLSDTSTTLRTVSGGSVSLNKLTIGGATGTSTTNLSAVTLTELASTKTVAHTVAISSTTAVNVGTWSVTGTSGNVVTFNSSAAATQRTLGLTNVTSGIDYLAVKDIAVSDANKFYVGANSTDSGNNTNVYFTVPPVVPAGQNVFRQVFRPVFREIFRPIF